MTALTMGGAGADKVLKDAKAIGADHIVRLDHEGWLDSNALQPPSRPRSLNSALRSSTAASRRPTPAQAPPAQAWLSVWDGPASPTSWVWISEAIFTRFARLRAETRACTFPCLPSSRATRAT